ncbi:DNA replication and repair protein RecF [Bacteroidetes/Chlorobi group bacterium Naka2016]|jgi:DNA replication and repair protein RecF|nr:MAG: DNA replication and repair protein RecF [Bacteroidetes/Chlorobi group bacterium Naka2016]
MVLNYVKLENVRNHEQSEIDLEPSLNIFFGPNGAGKTSILEAISIASFSKSFITNYDQNIVRHGENYYTVEVGGSSQNGIPFTFSVYYQIGKGKEIRDISGGTISSIELIGQIPLVVLYPDMREIIFGPPSARREFVDKIISQTDTVYLKKLIEYKRILKQRNKLLSEIANGDRKQIDVLSAWNKKFIQTASYIIQQRGLFSYTFSFIVSEAFETITEGKESLIFDYQPFDFFDFFTPENLVVFRRYWYLDQILSILEQLLIKYAKKEIERGITLFGPHKDDFQLLFNGNNAREVASQGQSKSILIALKNAEVKYLQNKKNTAPIVLFDDIFSELDINRINQVLDLMKNLKVQLLLTTTEIDKIKNIISNFENYGVYKVESGKTIRFEHFS